MYNNYDRNYSKINIYFFIIVFVIFGTISLILGKDVNWDLKNYHFYNSYSFLNDRLNYDYLPAQLQTYHNPLLSVVIYTLINKLPPSISAFILGGLQGINCFIVFLISQFFFRQSQLTKWNLGLKILIVVIGASSSMFVSEIGTTFGDNVASIFILLAFLLVILSYKCCNTTSIKYRELFFSGLLIGFSIGLKLTNMVYGISLTMSIVTSYFFINDRKSIKIFSSLFFTVGILLGTVCTGGYWMFVMYQNYKNPLFPYYNKIFKSPYFLEVNFRDDRFVPRNIFEAISYPFQFSIGTHPSLELQFIDLRWLFICFLFIIVATFFLLKKVFNIELLKGKMLEKSNDCLIFSPDRLIILFCFYSFLIWLMQFGYQRYLIPLELLSGLIIFSLITKIAKKQRVIYVFLAICIVIIFTTKYPDWGRASWENQWFSVKLPSILQENLNQKSNLVIMLGKEPISYVIPFFPENVRFVRVNGNFLPLIKGTKMEAEISEVIQNHNGNFFALYNKSSEEEVEIIKKYALEFSSVPCQQVESNIESLNFCFLRKK